MAGRGTVENSAPTKHSVRVDWFRRDPGGSTVFVMPGNDGAVSELAIERDDDANAQG